MPVNTNALQLKSATTVTIAAGVLIPTQALTIVAAESGTADDLATISLTGFTSLTDSTNTFRPMVILLADSGDTITVKDGTGNIQLNANADFSLTGNAQLLLIYNGTNWTDVGAGGGGGGSGTVTSVGVSTDASYLTVGSSPVTTSGTITLNKTTALTANQVVATPDGIAGTADLRALVAADIPSLPASQITSGQLALARGGTNADLSATGGTSNFLKQSSVGANITVGTIADADLPTVSISKGGTGQTTQTAAFDALAPTTTKGDIIVSNGTDNIRLAVGTNNFVLTADSAAASGVKWAASGSSSFTFAVLQDQKTSGTAGGTSTATTWSRRDLNTEVVDANSIVSISSNTFTPISGTYKIMVGSSFIVAANAAGARMRLYNTTGASVVYTGAQASIRIGTWLTFEYYFTANGTDAYEIQYYVSAGQATNGLGLAISEASAVERYMEVTLLKLA